MVLRVNASMACVRLVLTRIYRHNTARHKYILHTHARAHILTTPKTRLFSGYEWSHLPQRIKSAADSRIHPKYLFCGVLNFSGFFGFFLDAHPFFFEMLFWHLLPLIFPRPKQCKTPQKYPVYTMQFRSTHFFYATIRRFFRKTCFLG